MQNGTQALAQAMRRHVVNMTHRARASHIGSCFSIADTVAVLYGSVLSVKPEQPDWPDRDRLVFSKGHAAAILYAALAERGFFPQTWLDSYAGNNQPLSGHVTRKDVPGVEVSTGSLGHGLPIACGIALSQKIKAGPQRTYCIISDGECDEGTTWESALFAAHHNLAGLIVIVDYNKIQSFGRVDDVMKLEPLADKWRAFNWHVQEVDGHDHAAIETALRNVHAQKPSVIIAHTVKGKGVSFMEDRLEWHYKSPNDEQREQALAELS